MDSECNTTCEIDLRKEVQFEHAQIGQRIGWYASFQAFLFTAYTLSGNKNFESIPKVYLPSLGIIISILALLAIIMTIVRLTHWRRKLPPEGKSPHWLHWIALLYPMFTPVAIGVVWSLLLLH